MNLRRAPAVLAALSLAACQTTQGGGLHSEAESSVTRIQTGDKLNPYLFEFRSAPDTRVFVDSVAAPVDALWSALPGVYQELGLALTRVDAGRHLVGSQAALSRGHRVMNGRISGVLDCGLTPSGAPAADSYEVTLTAYSVLLPKPGGGTELQSLVEGRARDPVSNNPAATCVSKGTLEHAIRVHLLARVVAQ